MRKDVRSMRLNDGGYAPAVWRYGHNSPGAESREYGENLFVRETGSVGYYENKDRPFAHPFAYEGPAALLELSPEALGGNGESIVYGPATGEDNKLFGLATGEDNKLFGSAREEKDKFLASIRGEEKDGDNKSSLDDPTGRLTKRLVAANSRIVVQTILAEAYKSMGDIIQAAASGDKNAINVLRRLNKLIRRATRKFRELGNEEEIRQKKDRAQKKEIEELARQLELELKRKVAERKRREKKYLKDVKSENKNEGPLIPGAPSGAAQAAQIKAMARQAAQAAVMAQPSSAYPSDMGGISASGEASAESGESGGSVGGSEPNGEVA